MTFRATTRTTRDVPKSRGKNLQAQPATRDDLEAAAARARGEATGGRARKDAAEAANSASSEAEVARAEAQAKQEACRGDGRGGGAGEQAGCRGDGEAEAQAKQEAMESKAEAGEAAAAAMAEAQAAPFVSFRETGRPARLKTSYDSFSSMPATSPPRATTARRRRRRKRRWNRPEPVASKEPRFAKLRVALSRAAEIAKDAPFAKLPRMSPRTTRRAETALWKLGCFWRRVPRGAGAVGRETRADRADRAQEETGAEDAQAGARRRGAGDDGDGDGGAGARGGRTDVASPRILKEVFSP